MTAKVIAERFTNGRQSWDYEQVLAEPDGTKLRVKVDVDSYVAQSHASVERWDGDKWQRVVYRPGEAMHAKQSGYGPQDQTPISYASQTLSPEAKALFFRDRDEMLAEARAIIS